MPRAGSLFLLSFSLLLLLGIVAGIDAIAFKRRHGDRPIEESGTTIRAIPSSSAAFRVWIRLFDREIRSRRVAAAGSRVVESESDADGSAAGSDGGSMDPWIRGVTTLG